MKNITLFEEEFFTKKQEEKTVTLLSFRLLDEWYAVDILDAREVIRPRDITYLPGSPEHISGIIDLRGSILSVTDLKKIFGQSGSGETKKSRIVVVASGEVETGLLVDEIAGLVKVPLEKIDPALATIPQDKAEFIKGECKVGEKLIGIIKVEEVLKKK